MKAHKDFLQYSLFVVVLDIFLPATNNNQISRICNIIYISLIVLIQKFTFNLPIHITYNQVRA